MRKFNMMLCLILVVQLVFYPIAAFAGQVKCNTDQNGAIVEISGDSSTNRIGSLASKSAVVISSNRLDVLFSQTDLTEKQSSREPKLTGVLFGCKSDGKQKKTVTGYCFFSKGSQIGQLDIPGTDDSVTTSGGETCTGHITSVNRDQLSIDTKTGTKEISTSSITTVCSPRVFEVNMNLSSVQDTSGGFEGDAANMSFKATCTEKVLKASSSTTTTYASKGEKNTKAKKILIATLVLGVIATAITLPIVIPLMARGRGNNNFSQRAEFENLRFRQAQLAAQAAAEAP